MDEPVKNPTLRELLDQARAMNAAVLPEDVRCSLTRGNIVRLRLLSFRNVASALFWACRNPVRCETFLLRYMIPGISIREIAVREKIPRSTVQYYLQNPNIEDVYDMIPLEEETGR